MSKKPKFDSSTEAVQLGAEVTSAATDFATKSFDQAEAAFNKAGEVAHQNVQVFDAAASAFKNRAADLQMKAMEIAQANVNSAFAFARKAVAVKAPTDLVALNQEFAKTQMEAFSKQAAEMNELFLALAKETARPMQEGMTRTWGNFGKTFAA
jgi:hypothetical protein